MCACAGYLGEIGERNVRERSAGRKELVLRELGWRAVPNKRKLDAVRSAVARNRLGEILAERTKADNADAVHLCFS